MLDDWRAGDIRARWLAVLKRLHGNCRGAPGRDDYFRFEVVDIGDDGADLVIHAFLKRGERYCCPEPGCQFVLSDDMWPRWRAAMAEECIDHLNPVRILAWRVTVEEGAILDHGGDEGPGRRVDAARSFAAEGCVEPEDGEKA